jgi:TonB family protein
MKCVIVFLFFLPLISFSQKIKVNEYDKFLKKRKIESFPLTIKTDPKIKMAISFGAIDSSLYLQLNGAGLGANVIGEDDLLILLLDNDSTINIKSKGLQTYDVSKTPNTYKHEYVLTLEDLEKLSRYNMQALRKYHANEFEDIYIPKENFDKVKKLSALFIEEFKIGEALHTIQSIDIKDIAKYIGDSVTFVGRISSGKYLPGGKSDITILNVGSALSKQLLTVVIPGVDRKNFGSEPENFYQGKEARITGKVELDKEKLQIVVSNREQLIIMGDTTSIVAAKTNHAEVQPTSKEALVKPQIPARAPGFPGGYSVWIKFLNRNLKRPPELEAGESKTVVVQFLVSADGDVNNIQIKESAGTSFDTEVLRVLKRMPKWKPAIENGQPADAVVTQSVTFFRAYEAKSF